jgi:TfoX/Sxy family transcriptional regulator of competence genes
MAYDSHLAERITKLVERHKVSFYVKEMMGGITWMVAEKMCISIFKGNLMVRVEPDELEEFLGKPGATQMIHGGKAMTGYLTVSPEGYDMEEDLEYWVNKCLEYNPKAKASKKKKA